MNQQIINYVNSIVEKANKQQTANPEKSYLLYLEAAELE